MTLSGGVAHRVVDDSANGLAGNTLTAPPAGGQLSNVALFIDQNSEQLDSVAEVKFWGWGWGCARMGLRLASQKCCSCKKGNTMASVYLCLIVQAFHKVVRLWHCLVLTLTARERILSLLCLDCAGGVARGAGANASPFIGTCALLVPCT